MQRDFAIGSVPQSPDVWLHMRVVIDGNCMRITFTTGSTGTRVSRAEIVDILKQHPCLFADVKMAEQTMLKSSYICTRMARIITSLFCYRVINKVRLPFDVFSTFPRQQLVMCNLVLVFENGINVYRELENNEHLWWHARNSLITEIQIVQGSDRWRVKDLSKLVSGFHLWFSSNDETFKKALESYDNTTQEAPKLALELTHTRLAHQLYIKAANCLKDLYEHKVPPFCWLPRDLFHHFLRNYINYIDWRTPQTRPPERPRWATRGFSLITQTKNMQMRMEKAHHKVEMARKARERAEKEEKKLQKAYEEMQQKFDETAQQTRQTLSSEEFGRKIAASYARKRRKLK